LRRLIGLATAVAAVVVVALAIAAQSDDPAAEAQNRPGRWVKLPSAALERTEVVAARVGRSIFALGGFVPGPQTTNAVERYDLRARRWRRVRPLPIAVNHGGATASGGTVSWCPPSGSRWPGRPA